MKKKIPPFFEETFDWLPLGIPLNKKVIAATLVVLTAITIPMIRSQMRPDPLVFAKAEALFNRWESSSNDQVLLSDLQKTIQNIPQLREKYDTAIAHKMIQNGQGSELFKVAQKAMSIIEQDAPLHADFAETTLLIEQSGYQQALERAVRLKQKMLNDQLTKTVLFGENLIRIAHLQQELKNGPGEKAAWDDVQSFFKEETSAAKRILQEFQAKRINLESYINSRQRSLKN
jgi:hypothetical protein